MDITVDKDNDLSIGTWYREISTGLWTRTISGQIDKVMVNGIVFSNPRPAVGLQVGKKPIGKTLYEQMSIP